ncbi:MAG: GNAT family N-acetyltransferase [Oscillospiraceae bacterium]|nr:GNAT family N-acetyltransferase [Oscillospiraceae bacterium]
MQITDREITKPELEDIYKDFRRIELRDGVPDAWQRRLQFLAQEQGVVIGFASGLTNHKWFYLTDLWVHEAYRRQGLGTKLLAMLEERAISVGMEHIYTWTSGFTNPLFYEKQGYQAFAVFEDFFEVKGYHHIGYRKDFDRREIYHEPDPRHHLERIPRRPRQAQRRRQALPRGHARAPEARPGGG